MIRRRPIHTGMILLAIVTAACAGAAAERHVQSGARHAVHMPHLTQPGNDIFGAIHEIVQKLDADPNTDWSKVNIEALRQHLLDMQAFTDDVRVVSKQPIPNGVKLVVQPTTPRAVTALQHLLSMHPMMLKKEAGWTMRAEHDGNNTVLVVTTPNPGDVAKIRALGYIGLMAYGSHHRRHHWLIATGQMAWPPSPMHGSMR